MGDYLDKLKSQMAAKNRADQYSEKKSKEMIGNPSKPSNYKPMQPKPLRANEKMLYGEPEVDEDAKYQVYKANLKSKAIKEDAEVNEIKQLREIVKRPPTSERTIGRHQMSLESLKRLEEMKKDKAQKTEILASDGMYMPDLTPDLDIKLENIGKTLQSGNEKGLYNIKEGLKQGLIQNWLSNEYYRKMNNLPNQVEKIEAFIKEHPELQESYSMEGKDNFFKRATRGIAKQAPMWFDAAAHGMGKATLGAVTGAGAAVLAGNASPLIVIPEEAITVPAASLFGFRYGMSVGTTEYIAAQEAGQSYVEMIMSGVDPEIARPIALTTGAVNGLLESAQIGSIGKSIPGVKTFAEKFQKSAIKEGAKRLAKIAGSYGYEVGENVLEEVLQQGTTIAGVEAGKLIHQGKTGEQLERRSWTDVAGELIQTGQQALVDFSLLPSVGVAKDLTKMGMDQAKAVAYRKNQEKVVARFNKTIYKDIPGSVNVFKENIDTIKEKDAIGLVVLDKRLDQALQKEDLKAEDKAQIEKVKAEINTVLETVKATAKEKAPELQFATATDRTSMIAEITSGKVDVGLDEIVIDDFKSAQKAKIVEEISTMLQEGKDTFEIGEAIKEKLPKSKRKPEIISSIIQSVEKITGEADAEILFQKIKDIQSAMQLMPQNDLVAATNDENIDDGLQSSQNALGAIEGLDGVSTQNDAQSQGKQEAEQEKLDKDKKDQLDKQKSKKKAEENTKSDNKTEISTDDYRNMVLSTEYGKLLVENVDKVKIHNEGAAKNNPVYKRFKDVAAAVKNNPLFNGLTIKFIDQDTRREWKRSELDEAGYKHLQEGWYEIAGQQESHSDSSRTITLYRNSSKDTIAEELIHDLQKRIFSMDPELEASIQEWEENVHAQAISEGFNIPDGYETFAQALVFSEMGYADANPELAELFSVPDEIVDRINSILGSDLVAALTGTSKPELKKSIRMLNGKSKKVEGTYDPLDIDNYDHIEPEKKLKRAHDIDFRVSKSMRKKGTKAIIDLYPEFKPFFQQMANDILADLNMTIPAEWTVTQTDLDTVLERYGRITTKNIAFFKDVLKASYADILASLTRLSEGKAKNTLDRKIELVIDDNLTLGYENFFGDDVPPNKDYLELKYGKEAVNMQLKAAKEGIIIKENGTVVITPEAKITKAEYAKISTAMKRLGYDWKGAEDAENLMKRFIDGGYSFNPDQSEALKKIFNLAAADLPPDQQKIMELVEKAKKTFGITGSFKEAGYLTLDGRLLDFSGKRDGAPGGSRYMDHREIQEIYDDGLEYGAAMYAFMDDGNIRMKPEMDGFEITQIPTEKQIAKLKEYITRANGEVTVDLTLVGQHYSSPESIEYPKGTRASRIFADIENFYKTGEVYRSTIRDFHYQLKPTQDPKFVEWFKDSKVVDRNGEPLVVYHGTDKEFTEFDKKLFGTNQGSANGQGFYFTSSKGLAQEYGINSIAAYLSLQNPFNYNVHEDILLEKAKYLMNKYDKYNGDTQLSYVKGKLSSLVGHMDYLRYLAENKGITTADILKDLGFDGYKDGNVYLAFEPTQIKSVDNTGLWDPNNPDIRYQLKPAKDLNEGNPFNDPGVEKINPFTDYEAFEAQLNKEKAWLTRMVEQYAAIEFKREGIDEYSQIVHPSTKGYLYQVTTLYKDEPWSDSQHDSIESVVEYLIGSNYNQVAQAASFQLKSVNTPEFERWFVNSQVVDEDGNPKVVYSGHNNTPLFGSKFDIKKATAGAFYTTEDPDIASNYANNKMGVKETFENGSEYLIYGKNGKPNKKIWQIQLDEEQQKKADEYLQEIGYDFREYIRDNKQYDAQARRWGIRGGLRDLQNIYEFMDSMGDTIAQYNYGASNDTPLFLKQIPSNFEDLLSAIGLRYESYLRNVPGVFPLYISMQKPLITADPFPSDLMAALETAAKRERRLSQDEVNERHWTSEYPLRNWIEDIKTMEETGEETFWATQVPTKALPILKQFGYDGIKDNGGKMGGVGHTVWISFDSENVKSAIGNKGGWDRSNPNLNLQLKPVETFYSTLQKVLDAKMPRRATAAQIMGIIKSNQVKADEVKWSGIEDFLEGKEIVGKEELLQYLKDNDLKINETINQKYSPEEKEDAAFNLAEYVDNYMQNRFFGGYDDRVRQATQALENSKDETYIRLKEARDKLYAETTKYSQYKLPGGSNYREMLFTLPVDEVYKSSHWDEANVLAHTRLQDFIDAKGNKVLFIEEVQSDWHQAGRKHGYKTQEIPEGYKAVQYKELYTEKPSWINSLEDWTIVDADGNKMGTYPSRSEAIRNVFTHVVGSQKIPDAPFSKTWHEFVLKRLIRYAADNGYDAVAWTNGEQQSDRYDLSKQINILDASYYNNVFDITAYGKENRLFKKTGMTESEAVDVIGKEMVEKIKKQPTMDYRYTGLDLKVGGEGMKGFYDKMIPTFLNKYLKKWGVDVEGISVGATTSKLSENYLLWEAEANADGEQGLDYYTGKKVIIEEGNWLIISDDSNNEQYSYVFKNQEEAAKVLEELQTPKDSTQQGFILNEEMKNSAVYEGQPLYSIKEADFDVNRMSYYSTVENNPITDPILRDKLKQTAGLYVVKHNVDTVNKGLEMLYEMGTEAAKMWIMGSAPATAEMNVIAQLLIKQAMDNKDYDTSLELIDATAKKAKDGGQATQVLSLFGMLTPQGIVRYTRKTYQNLLTEGQINEVNEVANEIENKLKEINKKAVEDMDLTDALKDIAEKTPEEMLARKIANTLKDKEANEYDPVKQMVETLFKVYKETVGLTQEKPIDNTLTFIAHAITEREKYREVWNQAREIVKEKTKDDPNADAILDEYFDLILMQTFPDSMIEKAVRTGLKELKVKIDKVVRQHFSEGNKVTDTLSKKLIAEAGLNGYEAMMLEDYIEKTMRKLTAEAKERILRVAFKDKSLTVREKKTLAAKIIEMSNLGAFKNASYKGLVAAKLGYPALTTEIINSLDYQAQQIQLMEEGHDKDVAIAKMLDTIAAGIPVSFWRKVSTLQTMAQLLNPKTIIRNVVGNTAFQAIDRISRIFMIPLDAFASWMLGTERTKTFIGMTPIKDREGNNGDKWGGYLADLLLGEGFREGWDLGLADALAKVDTSGLATQYELPSTRTFREKEWNVKNSLNNVAAGAETVMNIALRVTDRAAFMASFTESLKEQMKIANVTEATPEMVETATAHGLIRTFQDANKVSDFFVAAKRWLNIVGTKDFGLGDLLLKYPKTPGNLLARTIDYSPLGVLSVAFKLFLDTSGKDANGKKVTKFRDPAKWKYESDATKRNMQRATVEGLGRAITGTALITAGILLAKAGIISGGDEDDWDVYYMEQLAGLDKYQINTSALRRWIASGFNDEAAAKQKGDTLASYDWMQPFATNLAVGVDLALRVKSHIVIVGDDKNNIVKVFGDKTEAANYVKLNKDKGYKSVTSTDGIGFVGSVVSALEVGSETLANQPLLSGIQKLFGARDPVAGGLDVVQGAASSFIPTLFSQITQLVDNEKKSTYDIKWEGEAWRLVKRKIPGQASELEPSLDVFGESQKYYDDKTNPIVAALYTFLSPAIVKKYDPSPEAEFILGLYGDYKDKRLVPTKVPKKVTVEGVSVTLTPIELTTQQEYAGKAIQERLSKEEKLNTEKLSEEEQIKRIDKIYDEVYNEVKENLRKSRAIPKKKP